jgi:hypothetical protein
MIGADRLVYINPFVFEPQFIYKSFILNIQITKIKMLNYLDIKIKRKYILIVAKLFPML